jgi:hypothetical protein
MTTLQLTLPVPGSGPAILTLPQPLTPAALGRLEQAVASTLGMLRRDLRGGADDALAIDDASSPSAAGAIEYASWLPDTGAIEYASWTALPPPSRR